MHNTYVYMLFIIEISKFLIILHNKNDEYKTLCVIILLVLKKKFIDFKIIIDKHLQVVNF